MKITVAKNIQSLKILLTDDGTCILSKNLFFFSNIAVASSKL